jgi:hypothetical protein
MIRRLLLSTLLLAPLLGGAAGCSDNNTRTGTPTLKDNKRLDAQELPNPGPPGGGQPTRGAGKVGSGHGASAQ